MILSSTFSGGLEFHLGNIRCQESVPEPILIFSLFCASSNFLSPFPAFIVVSILDTLMLHQWREPRKRNRYKIRVPMWQGLRALISEQSIRRGSLNLEWNEIGDFFRVPISI